MMKFNRALIVLAGLTLFNNSAWCASEEIQVYMDEMNAPNEFGLDIHTNYVTSGSHLPDYPGAQAPAQVLRVTPEFSYGITANWELGAYVLMSNGSQTDSTVDGEKVRLKFLATKEEGQHYFWGANLEVGKVNYRLNENPWNGELKGIVGYRDERWTFATNPNIAWKISGPVADPASFHLDSKMAYRTDLGFEVGMESYNEFGPLSHMGHFDQQSQTLFAVVDVNVHGWDLDLGLGRGFTAVSDRWLVKAIISVPF